MPSRKKSNAKTIKNYDDFRKVVFSDKMQGKKEEFLFSEKKEQSKKKRQRLSERRYLWLKAECAARFKYL